MEIFGDNLVLIEKIADGGMGEVHLAKLLGKAGFEKTVAVKRIHPRISGDKEFKMLFESEVKLSALLQHQNIIQAFGNGEINGYLYLVMEFIDGCSLQQLLRKLREKGEVLPVNIALLIMHQVCEGLAYAHDLKDENTGAPLNIIHRDLSPDNIMITYTGVAKIVDFGIVKTTDTQKTRTGIVKGKIAYMSPEQARGDNLDKRSDLFSFFTILWEAFTGDRLFKGKNEYELFKALEESEIPELNSKISHADEILNRIMLKGLDRSADKRFQSAQEIYQEIRKYLSNNYPTSDRNLLSDYLRKQFAEEIKNRKAHWEEIRGEAEKFISSARIKIDSRLLPKKQIVENIYGKQLEDSATRISQFKSDVRSSPYTAPQIANPKQSYFGWSGALLLAFCIGAYFYTKSDASRDIASQNVKTLVLPDIQNSSYGTQIEQMESSGLRRFALTEVASFWHYWDLNEIPAPNWASRDYNPSDWKVGQAPFGYGDPVHTTISFGTDPANKYPTAYFRKEFQVQNSSRFSDLLLLGIRRDDAAVVYINGYRIFADPLKGPIAHETYAAYNKQQENIIEYVTLSTTALVEGKNTIAVEVHQVQGDSSDLAFDAFLVTWIKP